jgi:hypothetical protein
MFVHLFNAEIRASVSISGGAGAGGTVEYGVSVAYDEESKEPWWAFWRKISVQPYRTLGGGAYADASISVEGNIGVSRNNHAGDIVKGVVTVGGSVDTGLPITPDIGYEVTYSDDPNIKPFHNVSAGISWGVPNPVESHLYYTYTLKGWW